MRADTDSPCPGCGVVLAPHDGPTHRYPESSPACWALYGQVLAREYSDPACFAPNRPTVDAYAVQDPGRPSPQTVQSAVLHLISLHLGLERGVSIHQATGLPSRAARGKGVYVWLERPRSRGELTIAFVHAAQGVADPLRRVRHGPSARGTPGPITTPRCVPGRKGCSTEAL